MATITLEAGENDLQTYGLKGRKKISLSELVEKVNAFQARQALKNCHEIARKENFDRISLDEINAEIGAYRNEKSDH